MFHVPAKQQEDNALVEVESQRAIQEVQAALIMAKRFPRDENAAYMKIMGACERPSLAESATYVYPRGGQKVTGPSIRLAEAVAQAWGNLQFGIRELSQQNGWSECESFAWDIESNTRQVKVFKVPHVRFTKAGGKKSLNDPRDIYEMVANQGARRLRACILGVIPGDLIDAAVAKCEETLRKGDGKPLKDRIRDMLTAFEKYGVTREMIEGRLAHNISAIVEAQLVDLRKIYNSIKDGMTKREDWFVVPGAASSRAAEDLTNKVKKSGKKVAAADPEKKPDTDDREFAKGMVEIEKLRKQNAEAMDAALNEFKAQNGREPEKLDDIDQIMIRFDEIAGKA